MINKHDKVWKCCICNKHTSTLHEVFFGRGNRDICINHNLQVPLCPECHDNAHGKGASSITQDEYKYKFSAILGIDKEYAEREVKMVEMYGLNDRYYDMGDRCYLRFVEDRCRKAIDRFEQ